MPSHSTNSLRCESYTTPRSEILEVISRKNVCNESEEDTDGSFPLSARDDDHSVKIRVRSAPSHFSPQISQSLTERLLDNSEQCSWDDALVFESSVIDDWSEAASGWHVVVPYPKYVVQQPPTRHKSEYANKKGSVSVRTAVRCVDEDFQSNQFCPSWKGNVEPVTYRYVPNNGYYRNNKPIRDVRESPMVKKSKASTLERSRLTPEMRQAQKSLKRDLDNHFKTGAEENLRTNQSTYPDPDELLENYQESSVEFQQMADEQREKSSDRTQISKRLPFREQQLIKCASDLFMEKFNTRLTALEKEIQIPNAPAVTKKVTESTSASNHSPTQITKKLKEVRIPDTMKPTIQSTKQHSSNFGDDLFTVTPIMNKVPLRPLEKLTPKQKQMEKTSTASTTSRDRSPSPEMESPEDEELMIMLSCASSQPPPLQKDPECCGISTARSAIAMTNSDIEKMRNIPLRSEYGGKTKSSVVHKDSGPTVVRRGTMRYTMANIASMGQASEQPISVGDIERKELLPHMDRPIEKKFDALGGTLPEIMGKRLRVITTSQRFVAQNDVWALIKTMPPHHNRQELAI